MSEIVDERLREVETSLAVHLAECSEKSKRFGDKLDTVESSIAKVDRSLERLTSTLTRIGVGILIIVAAAALTRNL